MSFNQKLTIAGKIFFGSPDAISFHGNIDLVNYGGVDWSPAGVIKVLKGKSAGKVGNLIDGGGAVGFDIGGSFIVTEYFYSGNANDININDFTGFRVGASAGFSFLLEGGMGVSYAPVSNGEYIIGIVVSVSIPIGFKLLRTEHKHIFITHLVILDHSQGRKSFT